MALAEFKRVLKVGGLTWLVVPDIQKAAEWVVNGDIDDQPLYISPAGPVHSLWMFYGMGTSIPGIPYMAHKTMGWELLFREFPTWHIKQVLRLLAFSLG